MNRRASRRDPSPFAGTVSLLRKTGPPICTYWANSASCESANPAAVSSAPAAESLPPITAPDKLTPPSDVNSGYSSSEPSIRALPRSSAYGQPTSCQDGASAGGQGISTSVCQGRLNFAFLAVREPPTRTPGALTQHAPFSLRGRRPLRVRLPSITALESSTPSVSQSTSERRRRRLWLASIPGSPPGVPAFFPRSTQSRRSKALQDSPPAPRASRRSRRPSIAAPQISTPLSALSRSTSSLTTSHRKVGFSGAVFTNGLPSRTRFSRCSTSCGVAGRRVAVPPPPKSFVTS
jgi:hypothetical protein